MEDSTVTVALQVCRKQEIISVGIATLTRIERSDHSLTDGSKKWVIEAYDFIDNGYPERLFESRVKFKKSENLNTLPQIKKTKKTIQLKNNKNKKEKNKKEKEKNKSKNKNKNKNQLKLSFNTKKIKN